MRLEKKFGWISSMMVLIENALVAGAVLKHGHEDVQQEGQRRGPIWVPEVGTFLCAGFPDICQGIRLVECFTAHTSFWSILDGLWWARSFLASWHWQHTVISKTPQLQLFSSLFSIYSVQVLSRIVYSIYFKYYIIYILYTYYINYVLCLLWSCLAMWGAPCMLHWRL